MPKRLTDKQASGIRHYLDRGYLNYGQICRHFNVSRYTVCRMNNDAGRMAGKKPQFNGISFAYFKVLYQLLGSCQKVADHVGDSQQNIYRLLNSERTSINYVR